MEKLKKLLGMLEERLVQHDNNREEVQKQLKEICTMAKEETDSSEARESKELREAYEETEERILSLIGMLNSKLEGTVNSKDLDPLIERAEQELKIKHKHAIDSNEGSNHSDFTEPLWKRLNLNETEETDGKSGSIIELITSTVKQLEDHLERIHDAIIAAISDVEKVYNEKRSETDEFADTVNKKLEVPFTKEDARLQAVVKAVREGIWSLNPAGTRTLKELTMKAKEGLLTIQRYKLLDFPQKGTLCDRYDLIVEKKISLKCIGFERRMPIIILTSPTCNGGMHVFFTLFDEWDVDAKKLLSSLNLTFDATVKIWEKGTTEYSATTETLTIAWTFGNTKPLLVTGTVSSGRTHLLKMRVEHNEERTQWSNTVEFTPDFNGYCAWKKCPSDESGNMKYSVDEGNPRIATFIGGNWSYCTIIGNTPLPLNTVVSWSIKVLESKKNDGNVIFIGVAPTGINQNIIGNSNRCMWYFDCYSSTLHSGPPHYYGGKGYGPRKERGQYVHTGDSVGVVMDTRKGDLSFVVNGVNLGVAYEEIPLDKPLVPCVLLGNEKDSVELETLELKEIVVDSSILVPSSITAKSETWNSITLTWDAVEGASFYQIEVDGSKSLYAPTTNRFTKRGLLPETEHTFRVRTVRGNLVSEWSDVVKMRMQKAPEFSECVWKECPDNVDGKRRYSVDEKNPRIAIKIYNSWCTLTGNTFLPLNKVVSWNIKILESRNNGNGIFVGVVPFIINKNEVFNNKECGWYFHCYSFTLCSGPPHNYWRKEYGSRKKNGYYVHEGDSVGVVMDTTKGELSFIVDGVNLGVAYEEIPLDKPLVPCVVLKHKGDSVELVI